MSSSNLDPLRDEETRSFVFELDLPSLEGDLMWSVTDLTPVMGEVGIGSTGRRGAEPGDPPSQIPRTP